MRSENGEGGILYYGESKKGKKKTKKNVLLHPRPDKRSSSWRRNILIVRGGVAPRIFITLRAIFECRFRCSTSTFLHKEMPDFKYHVFWRGYNITLPK